MQRPRSVLLAGLPLAVAVAGCSGASPNPYSGNVPHPAGDEVVVRVEWTGGFVPYEWNFSSLPNFTLLGDGRVIVPGPVIMIYPGPALPNLQVRQLTEEGTQSVLFRIAETGLFEDSQSFNAATQYIADANSTVFTVNANDRSVVVDVYALGLLTDDATTPESITQAERDAHAALAELDADLQDLESWISADDWATPAWEPYQPTDLRLLVANVDAEPPNPDGLDSDPLPWPGTTAPDELGDPSQVQDFRCGVVSGDEAATWLEALASANQLTRWSADGHVYRVTPRPLLPDEALDCGTFTL
jgi:hypothetical protein